MKTVIKQVVGNQVFVSEQADSSLDEGFNDLEDLNDIVLESQKAAPYNRQMKEHVYNIMSWYLYTDK